MLQSVAEEFVKIQFEKMDGVVGVLLMGICCYRLC
jgi:hypothetical protein